MKDEPNLISFPQQAVEGLHHFKATFREIVPIKEEFEGEIVWDGSVYVFDLEDHQTAKVAYAWSYFVDHSKRLKAYAELHEGHIKSPADAALASIVRDYQGGLE